MAYCSNCGACIADGSRFCSSCGASVAEVNTVTTTENNYSLSSNTLSLSKGLCVMLVSLGTCTERAAIDLIAESCGYTDAEAKQMIANCPIPIAQNLTQTQAAYLAQAMAEYGMEVTVYDQGGYRTINSGLNSVFSSAGGFLQSVVSVLSAIGHQNRINHKLMRRWSYPHHFSSAKPPLIRPAAFVRPEPIPRRSIRRDPMPEERRPAMMRSMSREPTQPARQSAEPSKHQPGGQRREQPGMDRMSGNGRQQMRSGNEHIGNDRGNSFGGPGGMGGRGPGRR